MSLFDDGWWNRIFHYFQSCLSNDEAEIFSTSPDPSEHKVFHVFPIFSASSHSSFPTGIGKFDEPIYHPTAGSSKSPSHNLCPQYKPFMNVFLDNHSCATKLLQYVIFLCVQSSLLNLNAN